jgi:NAD(P) transhydrogenase subunit alpha
MPDMILAVPAEAPPETRVALVPEHVSRLAKLGVEVRVAEGLGRALNIEDADYIRAGAAIGPDPERLLETAEMLIRIRRPSPGEASRLKEGALLAGLLDPFNDRELIDVCRKRRVTAISLEMLPRITRAQKMDVLSSQANLAGYAAVVLAAERLAKIFPMMMTPAGTIAPARVFVVGAGVAGLQAIATAKRLGARVEAFDTRPVVEEQVRSLGARFVKVDLGETGQTRDGYARELSDEQIARQRETLAKVCASADVVITTAQVFGRRAPLIITAEMLRGMPKGSVVVDLAVETGGNVAGSQKDEERVIDGVRVVGLANLPGKVAVHASQMFSANMLNLVAEFWDAPTRSFRLDLEDEILKGCVVTHAGRVVNDAIARHHGAEAR